VQDLEAGIGIKPSNAQKLRHIIVLPEWLKHMKISYPPPASRGALATFSTERGLTYSTAREGMFRARRVRYIIRCSGKPGLEVLLGLIMSKWRRFTEFYEECNTEYTVLLYKRHAAVRHAVKFGFGA
jgi:hypothetical protein